MNRQRLLTLALIGIAFIFGSFSVADAATFPVRSDEDQPRYFVGTIRNISPGSSDEPEARHADVLVTTGPLRNQRVTAVIEELAGERAAEFSIGSRVVIAQTAKNGEAAYVIVEHYRIPSLTAVLVLFFCCAVVFGRKKGLRSILGLGITIAVLAGFIVPQIADGKNPLIISIAGSLIIAVVSLYFSHGFEKRTTVALFGTVASLAIAALLSVLFVGWAKLFGTGSEEALFLETGTFGVFNMRGLLLGAIILGSLGVLDDVTTAQSATVEELARANPFFSYSELYRRGLSVGREHIASLVNTLVLAYASVSLPLFLLFLVNRDQPIWVTLNSEFIAEEIIRTLVGSTALIFAVPVTTAIAALAFSKLKHAFSKPS